MAGATEVAAISPWVQIATLKANADSFDASTVTRPVASLLALHRQWRWGWANWAAAMTQARSTKTKTVIRELMCIRVAIEKIANEPISIISSVQLTASSAEEASVECLSADAPGLSRTVVSMLRRSL